MKAIFRCSQNYRARINVTPSRQRAYCTAIWLASLACGGAAMAQTTNAPPPAASTNAPASGSSTNVTKLQETTVVGKLNEARSQINPDIGGTVTTMTADQILSISQGENAPFNEVILRAPGVAQDSAANGDLHVRGEHANLQYRINDVLLPEGISGFGLELDPRFVDTFKFITGSLPAEYGFRTAAVVDIQTKSGALEPGGEVDMYGGSHDTIRPSFEYGGTDGKLSYFIDGSFDHNSLGIENPTPSSDAIHDVTDQYKTFAYFSYLLDDTSRVSFIGSLSYADYQIPIDPNQPLTPQPTSGNQWAPGAFTPNDLNDNQNEQNYYGVFSYQKSAGDLNFQLAAFGRGSRAHYIPDNVPATLDFNDGVATDEDRILYSFGLQGDASYELNDRHTLRGGFMGTQEYVTADSTTTVFPVDPVTGDATGPAEAFNQANKPRALFEGVYIQDEWKLVPKTLTFNYGVRFDSYSSTTDDESQASPRANLVYQPTDTTTLHMGYSRYFTPPPLETVPPGNITAFNGTTAASGVPGPYGTVQAERANYYDLGVSQKITDGLKVGLDGYYKRAQNQLDDGLFGQALILSSFNYAEGRVYGAEFTANYDLGGFSTYANLAYSVAQGKGASSAQYLWGDQATVNYVNNNWIYLDHDQRITGSFGASYTWKESERNGTRLYLDALYGSGLRQDGDGTVDGTPTGDPVPNGAAVPDYYTINCGVEQAFKINNTQKVKARIDIVNLTDHAYELRSGTGVGVNAAQWGARFGMFGSISYSF
jgi:outer membrane receptor protein involved in Fe transport